MRKSILEPYKTEICNMYNQNFSSREINKYLRDKYNIYVDDSTVKSFTNKQPELKPREKGWHMGVRRLVDYCAGQKVVKHA